jgi:hypothetical protein
MGYDNPHDQSDFKKLVDPDHILRETNDLESLSITLKKTKRKGTGVFATNFIRKGELICYYRLKIFSLKNYNPVVGMIYAISICRKDGSDIHNMIGDVFESSFPPPLNDIPFWGPFCNEPSNGETTNCKLKMNLKDIYKNRKKLKVGDIIDYELVATRFINPGDEILWFYGPDYNRDYIVAKR